MTLRPLITALFKLLTKLSSNLMSRLLIELTSFTNVRVQIKIEIDPPSLRREGCNY